jgi:hypothetical protein
LNNDVISGLFFIVFVLTYFTFIGHLIDRLKLNTSCLKWGIFFVLLFFLNILAYKQSLLIFNSLEKNISSVFLLR